jgi:hypothetical protein
MLPRKRVIPYTTVNLKYLFLFTSVNLFSIREKMILSTTATRIKQEVIVCNVESTNINAIICEALHSFVSEKRLRDNPTIVYPCILLHTNKVIHYPHCKRKRHGHCKTKISNIYELRTSKN